MKKILLVVSSVLLCLITVNAQYCCNMWDSVNYGVTGPNPSVRVIVVDDSLYYGDTIYVGGLFTMAEKIASNNIAKWQSNSGKWSNLGTGVNARVNALAIFNRKVIAGGLFDTAGGIYSAYIAQYNKSNWDSLSGQLNGGVYALASFDSVLFVGGLFTNISGAVVNRVAEWNGKTWSVLGSGFDSGCVYALAIYNDTVYAGGSFTSSNGVAVNHIAKWNGTKWLPVGGGTNNTVYCMSVFNGDLSVGGAFTQAGTVSAGYMAFTNGSTWGLYGAGVNDTVFALSNSAYVVGSIAPPNKQAGGGNPNNFALLAGGSFTMAGGINTPYAAMYALFNPGGGTYSYGWNSAAGPYATVYSIGSSEYGNYFGGIFDSVSGGAWSQKDKLANCMGQFVPGFGGGINELSNNGLITVYPNPSNSIFNFKLKTTNYQSEGKCSIKVYSMLGENIATINSLPLGGQGWALDLNNQPSGIYLYRVTDKNGKVLSTGKLMLER